MPGSAAFDTAIGLLLVFALLSVFCSGICEAISNALSMRARYLLSGMRLMLDRPAAGATPQADDGALPVAAPGGRSLNGTVKDPQATAKAAHAMNDLARAAADGPHQGPGAAPDAGPGTVPGKGPDAGAETPLDPAAHREAMVAGGGLTVALFGHPLLQSLQTRRVMRPGLTNPSYVSARSFTRALVDTLTPDRGVATTFDALGDTVRLLPDGLPAKRTLLALLDRAEQEGPGPAPAADSAGRAGPPGENGPSGRRPQGEPAAADRRMQVFERLVETWYDDQMERVSGWYKRWSKVVLAVVGLAVAVLMNVDAVQLTRDLYLDEPVRQAVVAQASAGQLCGGSADPGARAACARRELRALAIADLPVWWPHGCGPSDLGRCFRYTEAGPTGPANVLVKIAGWLLTAFAVSFGAPFWFQALSRVGSLRSTGPPPGTGTGAQA